MLRPRRLRSRVPASHQNRASASIWSPQNPESMPQDSLTHTQLGIPDSTPPESALGRELPFPGVWSRAHLLSRTEQALDKALSRSAAVQAVAPMREAGPIR